MTTVNWLEAQNGEDALTAQAAADTLWGRVQQWRALQMLFVVALPATLAVIAQWDRDVGVFAAMFGFVMTMLDTVVITPFLVLRRQDAAQAQDRFDSIALGLPRSPLRRSNDLEESVLRELAAAQNRSRAARNRDWYSAILGRLPREIGRIACMRESAVWDARLRRRWSNVIAGVAIMASIGFLGWSIYGGQSAADALIRVLFPLTPAFIWASREWREQRDAARLIDSLRSALRNAWSDGIASRSSIEELLSTATDFGTALYIYRSSTFPVPHLLYSVLRGKQGVSMQEAAEDALREYQTTT